MPSFSENPSISSSFDNDSSSASFLYSSPGLFSPKASLGLTLDLFSALESYVKEVSLYEECASFLPEPLRRVYMASLLRKSFSSLCKIDGYKEKEVEAIFPLAKEVLQERIFSNVIRSTFDVMDFLSFLGYEGDKGSFFRDRTVHNFINFHGFSIGNSLSTVSGVKTGLSDALSSIYEIKTRVPSIYHFLLLLTFENIHPLKEGNGIVGHLMFANELKCRGYKFFPYLALVAINEKRKEYFSSYYYYEERENNLNAEVFIVSLMKAITIVIKKERLTLLKVMKEDEASFLLPSSLALRKFYLSLYKAYEVSSTPEGVDYKTLMGLGFSERTLRRNVNALAKGGYVAINKDGKKRLVKPIATTLKKGD